MPPVPIDPAALANAGANLLGAFWSRNQANRAREDRLAAGENILGYVNDNGLPDGYIQNAYQQLLEQYFNNNQNYQNQFDGLQGMFYSGIGDYRGAFDKINTPNYDNPVLDYLRSNLEQNNGQQGSSIEQLLGAVQGGGMTPNSQGLFDTLMGHGSTANPYIANLLDIGGNILQNNGMTPYTQNASDVASYFMRNGGMDGNTQALFDAGFQNRDTAAGGLSRSDALSRQGQQTLGFGQGLINNAQQTGGWDQNGQSQFNLGMQGIGGMQNFYNQDPSSILGATGQQAIQGLMNNPFTAQGFQTTQNTLQGLQNRPNISGNDQAIINASFPGAFGTSPDAQQNMGIAQGVAGQDVNALAPWFAQFMSQGNNLMSQFQGMGSNQITGGGGGGSVGYTPMSRDLGPADPKIQEYLEKALAEFDSNPIMSDDQVISFARDTAAGNANQAGMAAIKKAAAMGGPAPTIAGGGQMDSAIRSFASDSMRAQSEAMKDALMKNTELRLSRDGMSADLAKALGQLKLGREQIFGNMNIADANNATQASTANAQLADSAAGRSLQAQIANASNQQGMAKIMSELFGNMLGSATTQRGQNVSSQGAGLGALSDIMNATSNSQKNYLDALGGAASRGQSQSNANLAAISSALEQLTKYQGQYSTDRNSVLDALGKASEQQTSRGNTMMDNFRQLVTGAGDNAASRFGSSMTAGADIMSTGGRAMASGLEGYNGAIKNMNDALGLSSNALGIANDRLGQYANIFKTATDDASTRMTLGSTMTNQGLTNMRGFLDSAANVNNQGQDYAVGLGNIAAQLAQTRQDGLNNYGSTSVGFANNDLGNRTLMNTAFNDFLSNLNQGIGNNNSAWALSQAPYAGILGQQLQYLNGTQNLMGSGGYTGLFGRG